MLNSKFKNKPNEQIQTVDGRTVWLGRSVAVVSQVIVHTPEDLMVLIVQRGPASMGSIGKWCFPCGYLDWNETTEEAAIRETFEEAGVDLSEMMNSNDYNHYFEGLHTKPWNVNSDPTSNRQNVSLSHCFFFCTTKDNPTLPETSTKFCEEGETADIKWARLQDVADGKYDMAFNHDKLAAKIFGRI